MLGAHHVGNIFYFYFSIQHKNMDIKNVVVFFSKERKKLVIDTYTGVSVRIYCFINNCPFCAALC